MGTIPTNNNTGNILNNTGMTQRAWTVVEVFKAMGQQPGEEQMLVYADDMETALNGSIASSTVLAQACTSMGKPNLNECNILGEFVGGDL
jgi:hypothetical protein